MKQTFFFCSYDYMSARDELQSVGGAQVCSICHSLSSDQRLAGAHMSHGKSRSQENNQKHAGALKV